MATLSNKLLWLLVMAVGIEIGAGIYEARVLVPLWASAPPASLVAYNLQALRPEPGLHFWIVSTPLVGLLGIANLVAAWRTSMSNRASWIAGAAGVVGIVALTFIYFVPTLTGFEAVRQGGDATLATSVHRWVTLNWVRAVVYAASWLCLLRACSHGAELAITPERMQREPR